MGFGWLTRLGSPFLKIFWADISKNLKFFVVAAARSRILSECQPQEFETTFPVSMSISGLMWDLKGEV